jgi:IS605 OrfB family transposase
MGWLDLLTNTIQCEIFPTKEEEEILDFLIRNQNASMRYCFNRIVEGKEKAEATEMAKTTFNSLNSRYIHDSFELARWNYKSQEEQLDYRIKELNQKIKQYNKAKRLGKKKQKKLNNYKRQLKKLLELKENGNIIKPIFGGKNNFKARKEGKISKEEFQANKNKQLYSRGEKDKGGNLNLRVVFSNDKFNLRVNTCRKKKEEKYIKLAMWIPPEKVDELLKHLDCYSIKIIRIYKNTGEYKYLLHFSYTEEVPEAKINLKDGCLGIDTNPSGLALTLVNKQGQPIKKYWIPTDALCFSSENKTNNLIGNIALQVIKLAERLGVGIGVERLKFYKKDTSRKFNRISHQFVYSRLLSQIIRKAKQNGITVKEVNPAFTTFIGKAKYKEIYNMSNHHLAALVIARRALGYKERVSVPLKKLALNSMEESKGKHLHNWSLWAKLSSISGELPARTGTVHNLKELWNTAKPNDTGRDSQSLEGMPGNLPSERMSPCPTF